jgi:hypothetical protein
VRECNQPRLAFAAFGGFLFLNTLYLQEVRGLSPLSAGLCTLPLAALLVAWWRDPTGWRRAVPAATVLFVLSVALQVLSKITPNASTPSACVSL